MIKMSLPDVIDRYVIAKLKKRLLPEGDNFTREVVMLEAEFSNYFYKKRCLIYKFIRKLTEVHTDIWFTEASIRKAAEDELGLAEVGRRALIVRDLNRKRQLIKNEMIEAFGEGFKDCKMNYAGGNK